MARKRYTAEQIIGHLRQAEILISEGKTIIEAARHLGVSEQTYYRWRKEYGGMEVAQVHRLKELEQENCRLKRLVADQALDNLILKEAARGNSYARRGAGTRSGMCVRPWQSRSVGRVVCWDRSGARSDTRLGWEMMRSS